MKKPVLLMVRELNLGGTERQLTETARALDREHFTPHVGVFYEGGMRAPELAARGVPVKVFPVRSLWGWSAVQAGRQLMRYCHEHRIRLVHTFDTPANLFGVPAARWARVPVVLSSQRAFRELTPPFGRRLLRLTDRMADAIVVNCEAVRRDMIEHEGLAGDRLELCYNAIDTTLFAPPAAPASGDALTIGVVCGLRREKGLETLLEAFARVAPRMPQWNLLLVGSGPWEPELQALRSRLGIEERCRIEPGVRDVVPWLHRIGIFVLPSRSEALSNSLMEAMACGCAVVASRVGGNPELVRHEETGLLFDAGNAADLAAQLTRLAANASLRLQLAENATRFVRENFSLRVAAARMAAIYDRYLSRS